MAFFFTTQAKISKIRRSFTSAFTRLWIAGSVLSVTPAHALQTESGEWVAAGQLEKGTPLRSIKGIVRLDSTYTEAITPTPVISYELEGGLDYVVGEMPVVVGGTCDLKTIYTRITNKNLWINLKPTLKTLTEAEKTALMAELAKITDVNQLENMLSALNNADNMAAWKVLHGGGATNLLREIDAINKVKSLKNAGLSEIQIKAIAQANDIKGLEIADNLVKNSLLTNKAVLHLVVKNAKSLENVRPNIMTEIKQLSQSSNLKNPDGLHGFLDQAVANSKNNNFGWKYELDIANEKLVNSTNFKFSQKVKMKIGADKEVDILDYANSEIVEIKAYSSSNPLSMGDNINAVGAQIDKIDALILNQFTNKVGRIKFETGSHVDFYTADKSKLIQLIKDMKTRRLNNGQTFDLDNATKIIFENSHPSSPITILKSEW